MYPSKILLFGEYTVLLGSHALAIPYFRYKGEWAFSDNSRYYDPKEAESSNHELKDLLVFLKNTEKPRSTKYFPDIIAFEKDLDDGLFFKSDIPKGHGLGSSGALTAAIFNRYADISKDIPDILELRKSFSLIESFYHGVSSGIDPLISYLKSSIYFKNNNEYETVTIPVETHLKRSGLFLVNSMKNSGTSSLVTFFNSKCKSDTIYFNNLNNRYIPINNICIKTLLLHPGSEIFYKEMTQLTLLQLDYFREMIPAELVPSVKYGLKNDLFYMKLCGSGGGGYMLGFTFNMPETKRFFEKNSIQVIVY